MNDDNALSRGAGGFNCCAEEKWTAVFRHNYFIIWNPANTRAVAQWDYRLAQTTIIITIRIGIAGPETWPWENVNVKTAIKVWRRRKSKWQEFGSKSCVSLGGGTCLSHRWLVEIVLTWMAVVMDKGCLGETSMSGFTGETCRPA